MASVSGKLNPHYCLMLVWYLFQTAIQFHILYTRITQLMLIFAWKLNLKNWFSWCTCINKWSELQSENMPIEIL